MSSFHLGMKTVIFNVGTAGGRRTFRMTTGSEAPLAPNSRSRVFARGVLATTLLLLALWIARDFLAAMVWAVIITASLWPVYAWLMQKTGQTEPSNAAAALLTALVALLIFLPIVMGLQQLSEVRDPAMHWISEARESGIPIPGWLSQAPIAGEYLTDLWKANLSDPRAVAAMFAGLETDSVGGWMQSLGGNILHRIFQFGVSLMAVFFIFRDGRWVARRTMETVQVVFGGAGETLILRMLDAMRGIVTGTVLVALVEGVVIGAGYMVAGVPKPFIFAFLTATFAMLPFGAWIAFSGAALLLIAQGSSSAGAALFGWGAFIMVLGDHFLWPTIVGGAARLPFVLALIGIFGGLQAFGLVGLFVGPVIMACVLTIWREWLGTRVVQS
jgi:predicted PurR-regulated permease PerM